MITATKTRTHTGLCTTCASADACVFPKPAKMPKIFCEEFEGQYRNGHFKDADIQAILKNMKGHPRGRAKVFAGICANCEVRQTCTFPKTEGGIWHCEEYR